MTIHRKRSRRTTAPLAARVRRVLQLAAQHKDGNRQLQPVISPSGKDVWQFSCAVRWIGELDRSPIHEMYQNIDTLKVQSLIIQNQNSCSWDHNNRMLFPATWRSGDSAKDHNSGFPATNISGCTSMSTMKSTSEESDSHRNRKKVSRYPNHVDIWNHEKQPYVLFFPATNVLQATQNAAQNILRTVKHRNNAATHV
jgi:hypothetical protein